MATITAPTRMRDTNLSVAPSESPRAAPFREAMSQLASGVVLVTTLVGGRPWGMTVSSACPICTDPPTMLVSLSSHTALSRAISETERFGVNILGADALDVARFGSAAGAPKFLDDGLGLELGGVHPAAVIVKGALSHVDCDLVETVVHGTHTMFLGRVRAITVRPDHDPLVHYRRGFRRLAAA